MPFSPDRPVAPGFFPVTTLAGPALVAHTRLGIAGLSLGTDPVALLASVLARTGEEVSPAEGPRDAEVWEAVSAVLDGRAPATALTYDLRGLGTFTADVLGCVATISPGQTRSYSWVAEQVGRPRAVRAVGTAIGRNPVPLLIGCHRVLRRDGSLGGFSLGLGVKRTLLAGEARAA